MDHQPHRPPSLSRSRNHRRQIEKENEAENETDAGGSWPRCAISTSGRLLLNPRRVICGWFLACALAGLALCSRAQTNLVPFPWDWSRADESVLDLSRFLEAPAGRDGFVRVRDGHFVKPDGSRLRLWGVNLTAASGIPPKELAPRIADDLARFGFNVARFHHLDAAWGYGLFPSQTNQTRAFDPEHLDRLDFFLAELKKRGIYVSLTMNVLRRFKEGDGVRDWRLLGYGKGATYFNQRLIELQHEFTRNLLTHRNPYTGNEYRHEPAIISIEMVNENSLLEAWCKGRLVGLDDPNPSTWSPIPVSYGEELTRRYNLWLEANEPEEQVAAIRAETKVAAGAPVPRLAPEEFAAASALRFHTEADFLMKLESAWFTTMRQLIREELGSRSLLFGSADHSDGFAGYAHVRNMLQFDVIDGHGYWEHPNTGQSISIKNTPMVNDPLDAPCTQFARTPVARMPFTISEVNHPWPHRFAAEGFVTLAAYALFHDWDGIVWFTWSRGRLGSPEQGQPNRDCFDLSQDPVKLAQLTVAGLMWHRHDVAQARETLVRGYTHEELIEAMRLESWKYRPFFKPGFDLTTPLRHATRWRLAAASVGEKPAGESSPATQSAPPRIESDTGELQWLHADQKRGVIRIATPRSQSLIGFVRDSGHFALKVTNEFCVVTLSAFDDQPIADSRRLLLVATTGAARNTGQQFAEDGRTVVEWGKGPLWIEPVTGDLTLRQLADARSVRATPLTAEGRALNPVSLAEHGERGWTLELGNPATTWWLIEVDR
jgi:hypothetical protein